MRGRKQRFSGREADQSSTLCDSCINHVLEKMEEEVDREFVCPTCGDPEFNCHHDEDELE